MIKKKNLAPAHAHKKITIHAPSNIVGVPASNMGFRAVSHTQRMNALLQDDFLMASRVLVGDLVRLISAYLESVALADDMLHALRVVVVVCAVALAVGLAMVLIATPHFDGPRRIGPD